MLASSRHCWRLPFLAVLAGSIAACSPESLVGNSLPPDIPDPAVTRTPEGARAAYYGAIATMRTAFGGNSADPNSFIVVSALLTDEMQDGNLGLVGSFSGAMAIDSRTLPEQGDQRTSQYLWLQKVRGQSQEAQGALTKYAPDDPPALVGHLNVIEGYAEVFLADLFCSGIPLSTIEFEGDYTIASGSTTHEVYEHALTLFDSAIAVIADSARILHLAQVGKGRALLALGRYAEAAEAVAGVPDDFVYELTYNTSNQPSNDNRNFAFQFASAMPFTLVDQEGINGLPFISSNDPRSAWVASTNNKYGLHRWRPAKYATTGDSPIVLASGIEARLIEAEAALQGGGGDEWLVILNELRTDGTFSGVDSTLVSVDTTFPPEGEEGEMHVDTTYQVDTLWNAGSGGVAGLAPLTDPGTPEARVDLIFAERGYWLFLTGHRQGDLRRLVREYGRDPDSVFPSGSYPGGNGLYGTDVNLPLSENERLYNPKYSGCFNRNA